MDIGSKIRNARNEAGCTQERAAEALGVSRQTVSNWENGKSYPDIISVIKMSDLYSVSLDHLLKEEKEVKETYMEYLEESTNTVKSNERMSKAVLIAVCFVIYAITQLAFWAFSEGPQAATFTMIFKALLLPASALLLSVFAGRNNWWGRGKWALAAVFALLFMLVPSVTFVSSATEAVRTFMFPSFKYGAVGLAVSLAGLLAGTLMRRKK